MSTEYTPSTDYMNRNDHEFMAAVNDINGRFWKRAVRIFWESGRDPGLGLSHDEKARLQRIRNKFGPSALENSIANMLRLKASHS